jgi:hypothetical protein
MHKAEQIMHNIERGQDLKNVKLKLAEIFNSIVSHPCDFEAVWHPLGQMYIRLGKVNKKTLRLHIWLGQKSKVDLLTSPIHNHIWFLTSYILCGSIINHDIECIYQPPNPTHRMYEITYEGHLNILRPTDLLVSYKVKSSVQFNPGDRYTINVGDFHYTQLATTNVAVTAAVTEDIATTPPISLGPIQGQIYRMIRPKCLPDEISKAGQAVLSALDISDSHDTP